MRRLLQILSVMLLLAGVTMLAPGAGPAGATGGSSTTESTDTSTTESATSTTDTTSTTSTTLPPSTMVPASRGTAVQVAPTFPPPTAAPTLPPPSPLAVPANSGSGRRVVYSKSRMRVWIIEADGRVAHTYLVSGRINQPNTGTYSVFSRSSYTCSIKSSSTCMRWMVRFTKGPSGDNIGFHEIPRKNGVPLQSDAQLGQALSAGCVRQSTHDAWFMWNWAGVGTKVVVIW
jgi:lipoprotein-anchoring transpeptidase ErfK/SrfK